MLSAPSLDKVYVQEYGSTTHAGFESRYHGEGLVSRPFHPHITITQPAFVNRTNVRYSDLGQFQELYTISVTTQATL